MHVGINDVHTHTHTYTLKVISEREAEFGDSCLSLQHLQDRGRGVKSRLRYRVTNWYSLRYRKDASDQQNKQENKRRRKFKVKRSWSANFLSILDSRVSQESI